VLEEADVRELKILLARRDQHLQRLYRQVQEANGRLSRSWLYQLEMRVRRRVYELESSSSWPISRPLRALRRALRRGPDNPGGCPQQDD
jgi:hypothetical protein